MTVHLDTSVLIEALVPTGTLARALRALTHAGDRSTFSSLALYEWLRGPRSPEELALREALYPDETIVAFGPAEAARAAALYRAVRNPRGREADLAIASCAIEHGAALWTLNVRDFAGIPDLVLYRPA